MFRIKNIRSKDNTHFVDQIGNDASTVMFLRAKAEAIKIAARSIFLAAVKHTHPVTPPPYSESFFIEKVGLRKEGNFTGYRIGNNDPAAFIVEFGAHPGGGSTFVHGYHPLIKGVDRVANE